jgi:hypothetical protein
MQNLVNLNLEFKQLLNLTNLLFKIAIKKRSSLIFVILAMVSLLTSSAISGIDDKTERIFQDVTIFIQGNILILIAFYFSINYLEDERKSGIFIIPLSAGYSRLEYFISVLFSQIIVLLVPFFLFLFFDLIYIILLKYDLNLVFGLLGQLFISMILSFFIIAIGQWTSSLKSMIWTIGIYFIGNGLDELYIYSFKLHPNELSQNIYFIISKFMPHFYIFNSIDFSTFQILHMIIFLTIIVIFGYLGFANKILKIEN